MVAETKAYRAPVFPADLLDELNRRLLRELTDDPRARTTELARRLGVSTPTVRERVARLEEAGVIRGYRLDVDPAALGLPVAAWVRLRPGPGQVGRIAELAERIPEVVECHRISGEDCFLLRVQVPAIDALEGILDRLNVHGSTNSSFVVSTPVPPRGVPLD
ncbi:Lrp/AsnC family leucine-responsive transcriptional regulator [Kribbella amoyensis]|uniref:Lrp/AsnC family leucine-responsive transcriptional regulator n=1 Tax=Kribbella amoyensis TaxID=996641 RepID=A0A561BND8_9ACTN|nr:Lrp/AsnC family transcriptional regulator [Kribbella amoyensis]TWD80379.1 Lrp/AsnC family leucine-responsive transcriptional regulator [Kribbella amoyensis]